MKQYTPWKVRQTGGGVLEWTSPLGHTYTDTPPAPTVHFTPNYIDTGKSGAGPGGHDPGGPPPPF
jgi:hypothetical protein